MMRPMFLYEPGQLVTDCTGIIALVLESKLDESARFGWYLRLKPLDGRETYETFHDPSRVLDDPTTTLTWRVVGEWLKAYALFEVRKTASPSMADLVVAAWDVLTEGAHGDLIDEALYELAGILGALGEYDDEVELYDQARFAVRWLVQVVKELP